MRWKDFPRWMKGGIIGFLYPIILVAIPYFISSFVNPNNPSEIGGRIQLINFVLVMIGGIPSYAFLFWVQSPIALILLSVIFDAILGILIGFLSQTWKGLKTWQKGGLIGLIYAFALILIPGLLVIGCGLRGGCDLIVLVPLVNYECCSFANINRLKFS